MDGLRPGAYEGNALLLAAPRKVCVFRQESIPGVDAVCALLPAQNSQFRMMPTQYHHKAATHYDSARASQPPSHNKRVGSLDRCGTRYAWRCFQETRQALTWAESETQSHICEAWIGREADFARARMPS